MPLQITIEEKFPAVFIVTAIGSIDVTSYEDFQAQVDSIFHKGPKAIIFDLAGVDFIGSFGLGVVLTAKVRLEKSGAEFGLNKLQPQIKTAFEIIKSLPKQNVFSSVEEMDRYLAQIQMQVRKKDGL